MATYEPKATPQVTHINGRKMFRSMTRKLTIILGITLFITVSLLCGFGFGLFNMFVFTSLLLLSVVGIFSWLYQSFKVAMIDGSLDDLIYESEIETGTVVL